MIYMETERLILRNVCPVDIDVMFDYRNNEICSLYQRNQDKNFDDIANLIEIHKNDEISTESSFIIAAAFKENNKMAGEITVSSRGSVFIIGYTVSYMHHRNGYAFEALTYLINFLHGKYPSFGFISLTDPFNIPSMNLLEKLGYINYGYIQSNDCRVFGKFLTEDSKNKVLQMTKATRV